jgi:hypothetical protein
VQRYRNISATRTRFSPDSAADTISNISSGSQCLLAPVTFEGFTWNARSETNWLATRDLGQQASWHADEAGERSG